MLNFIANGTEMVEVATMREIITTVSGLLGLIGAAFLFGKYYIDRKDLDETNKDFNDRLSRKVDVKVFETFKHEVGESKLANEKQHDSLMTELKASIATNSEVIKTLNDLRIEVKGIATDVSWVKKTIEKH